MSRALLYVVDPMCSWCWGFAPVIAELQAALAPGVGLRYVMGGLAPDSAAPMDAATRAYVQDAWRAVAARTGAAFNHEFWTRCAPRRSTYPACRAMLLARAAGKEGALLTAIQHAYYRDARNPSDAEVLADLAAGLGMDRAAFLRGLGDPRTQAVLEADFALRDRMGARGYPSLGVETGGQAALLSSGWKDAATLRPLLAAAGLLA
ncbi:MAG TPA: DsbA family protein [Planctomycetota bacterium]